MAIKQAGGEPSADSNQALSLEAIESQITEAKMPPLHQWSPDCSGTMDLVIKRDGSWIHQGSAVKRKRLVRLFSTILRLEADGQYCLVTPVEKFYITVEDAPFIATTMTIFEAGTEACTVAFETNVGDRVVLDQDHCLQVDSDENDNPRPYIMVRDGLRALLTRSVYYQLAEACSVRDKQLGIISRGHFHTLGSV